MKSFYLEHNEIILNFDNKKALSNPKTMKGKLIIILLSLMTSATSMAQDDNVLSCPDDNHPHAIDLGLSMNSWVSY